MTPTRLTPSAKAKHVGLAAVLGLLLSSAGIAYGVHGGTDHLFGTGAFGNIEFVSKLVVTTTPDLVADVAVSPDGMWAFLANWSNPMDCPLNSEAGGQNSPDAGAWVIDISDLSNPKLAGFIPHHQDSRPGEGMQVLGLTTKFFNGNVLVMNNEQCGKNGKGGVSLWDVTNPLKPAKLADTWGDRGRADFHDIHSAFAWDAGDRAYVVIVDNIEFPDVDILDITDPRRPRLIAEYDLNMHDVDQPEIGRTDSFIHDMIVKEIGGRFIMLVSYWDGGFVKLDVTDPAAAVFLGDTDYGAIDPLLEERTGAELTPEGNAHQAEFTMDNRYFIGTDEDFDAFRPTKFKITTGLSAGTEHETAPVGGGPVTLLPDLKLNGPVVYGGYGCPDSAPIPPADSIAWPALAPGEEKIVVLQRGPANDPSAPEPACFPGEKAANGIAAGYDAVVLVARHISEPEPLPPFCGFGAFPPEPIVALCTTHTAYHLMFNTTPDFSLPYVASKEPVIGQLGEKVEVGSIFDGWGYVHLFDANTFAELDLYAIPEAHDPALGVGFGDLTVHEVATDPQNADRAYLSYYAGGIRALEIRCTEANRKKTSTCELVETGGYLDPDGNDFWGVEAFVRDEPGGQKRTYILGSDRDSGLWIFRVTD